MWGQRAKKWTLVTQKSVEQCYKSNAVFSRGALSVPGSFLSVARRAHLQNFGAFLLILGFLSVCYRESTELDYPDNGFCDFFMSMKMLKHTRWEFHGMWFLNVVCMFWIPESVYAFCQWYVNCGSQTARLPCEFLMVVFRDVSEARISWDGKEKGVLQAIKVASNSAYVITSFSAEGRFGNIFIWG